MAICNRSSAHICRCGAERRRSRTRIYAGTPAESAFRNVTSHEKTGKTTRECLILVLSMPRMIDLIRSSAVPSGLMHSAARGGLAVPPREMIEILVHLATENKVFAEQARMTLAGW